jgi:alcohol dehydrogenase class IV
VEQWLFNVGVTEKLADFGYTEKDLENATRLTFETPSLSFLLSVAPVKATEKIVRNIYMESLKPMCK